MDELEIQSTLEKGTKIIMKKMIKENSTEETEVKI